MSRDECGSTVFCFLLLQFDMLVFIENLEIASRKGLSIQSMFDSFDVAILWAFEERRLTVIK